jgi:hypothetical protein
LLALRGIEGPAYMLGRATPDEVAAAALVMPGGELRDLVASMRAGGLSDDQIAANLNTHGAPATVYEGPPTWGGPPVAPGTPPAA